MLALPPGSAFGGEEFPDADTASESDTANEPDTANGSADKRPGLREQTLSRKPIHASRQHGRDFGCLRER